MSDKVKFITVDYLKENTTINDNVDSNILVPYIYKSQDTHLQEVLGSTFYNRLKEGVVNSDLNADETALILTYIQPMVAEWTLYEVLPHLNYKFTNKSISKESSEWSTSSELSELKYLRGSIRDLAEFYSERLIKYLCDYETLFPEYQNPDDKENLRRNNKGYFNGVYIPKGGYYDKYHKKIV
jgi:hypothetical protein